MDQNNSIEGWRFIAELAKSGGKMESRLEAQEEKIVEMQNELARLQKENARLQEVADSERERREQAEAAYRELQCQFDNFVKSHQHADIEELAIAVEKLLDKYLLLEQQGVKIFMKAKVPDLATATTLRTFVIESTPKQLRAKLMDVIYSLMPLPDANRPAIEQHNTFNAPVGQSVGYTQTIDYHE